MEKLILNFKGTQRTLIGKINKKLRGWASYHRVEDEITSNIQYERCLLLTSGGDDYIVCESNCIAVEVINAPSRVRASYHRVEDAYEAFCRVDIVVWGLLTDLMCRKYPRWHRETITKKFWVMIFLCPLKKAHHLG